MSRKHGRQCIARTSTRVNQSISDAYEAFFNVSQLRRPNVCSGRQGSTWSSEAVISGMSLATPIPGFEFSTIHSKLQLSQL